MLEDANVLLGNTTLGVPAYGFDDLALAEQYLEQRRMRAAGGYGLFPHRIPTRTYVPNLVIEGDRLTTMQVMNMPLTATWRVLRRSHEPMAAGAYNVVLVADGPKSINIHQPDRLPTTPWSRVLNNGWRDCYVVWRRDRRTEILPPGEGVKAIRSGWGLLYSERLVFDDAASTAHVAMILIYFGFRIADKVSGKDDMLKIWCEQRKFWSRDLTDQSLMLEPVEVPYCGRMYAAAVEGFRRHCRYVPVELAEGRAQFCLQLERFEADMANDSPSSFHRQLRVGAWQEALRLVREPWQLAIVVDAFADTEEFFRLAPMPGRLGSRVLAMLEAHNCSDMRRAELTRWANEFAAARDNRWVA